MNPVSYDTIAPNIVHADVNGALVHLLQLGFTLACATATLALAQPSTCPDPTAVELAASAQGWSFVPYPGAYDSPKLKLESIELNPSYVRCKYDVGGGGMVRIQLSRGCIPGAGNWKAQGTEIRSCTGSNIRTCNFVCNP